MWELIKQAYNNDKKQIAIFILKSITAGIIGAGGIYCITLFIILIGG